jgi:hypothetical protein
MRPSQHRSLAQCPSDELPVVADLAGKQPQVHDRAIAHRREIDDLADSGGVFVSSDDKCAWCDLAGPRASSRKSQR